VKILAAALLAASRLTCSWTTRFVVMNSSGEPSRVTYSVKALQTHPAGTVNAHVEKGLSAWTEVIKAFAKCSRRVYVLEES